MTQSHRGSIWPPLWDCVHRAASFAAVCNMPGLGKRKLCVGNGGYAQGAALASKRFLRDLSRLPKKHYSRAQVATKRSKLGVEDGIGKDGRYFRRGYREKDRERHERQMDLLRARSRLPEGGWQDLLFSLVHCRDCKGNTAQYGGTFPEGLASRRWRCLFRREASPLGRREASPLGRSEASPLGRHLRLADFSIYLRGWPTRSTGACRPVLAENSPLDCFPGARTQ